MKAMPYLIIFLRTLSRRFAIAFALCPILLCLSVGVSLGQAEAVVGAERLVQTVSSRAQEIIDLVESSQYEGSVSVRLPLSVTLASFSAESDPDDVARLILTLVNHSVYEDGAARDYIHHDVVIECLVQALHFPDKRVRTLALLELSKYVSPNRLQGREKDLMVAWDNFADYSLLRLIGALEPDKVRDFFADVAVEGFEISEEIKARLGDRTAEHRLIKAFLAETDGRKKTDLARKLGYVRSHRALLNLASEMHNPMIMGDVFLSWSLRYEIIKAFAYAFPDEELFHSELREVVRHTAEPRRAPEAAEEIGEPYIERVEAWLRDRYHINWRLPRPPFHLKQSEKMRIRPIRQ